MTTLPVSIRPEQPGDTAAVRQVNEQAFGGPLEAGIVDAVRDAPGAISLVATLNGRVVGHILFTPVTIDPDAGARLAGLAPMSVLPGLQRQGIGGQLIRAGLDACRLAGYTGVVVVGYPEYYSRFGFTPAHTHGLRYEAPLPPDVFMALELRPAGLPAGPGVVRYRPEFAAPE